jgi:hypothetical protein
VSRVGIDSAFERLTSHIHCRARSEHSIIVRPETPWLIDETRAPRAPDMRRAFGWIPTD